MKRFTGYASEKSAMIAAKRFLKKGYCCYPGESMTAIIAPEKLPISGYAILWRSCVMGTPEFTNAIMVPYKGAIYWEEKNSDFGWRFPFGKQPQP